MTDQTDSGTAALPLEPVPGAVKAYAATHRRLCTHAGRDGQDMHWLQPGETCDRLQAPDLLDSPGLRQVRAYLDHVDALEAGDVPGDLAELAELNPGKTPLDLRRLQFLSDLIDESY